MWGSPGLTQDARPAAGAEHAQRAPGQAQGQGQNRGRARDPPSYEAATAAAAARPAVERSNSGRAQKPYRIYDDDARAPSESRQRDAGADSVWKRVRN